MNNWFCPRSALLRSLQIYWSGHTDTLDVQEPMIIYNPGLERFLTSSTVHKPKSNFIDTEGKIEAYTDFNRLYLDHCWTTTTGCSVEHCGVPRWIWDPTALHCQGTDGATADGAELQQDLWHALQRTGWPLQPHCESVGTDA